MSEVLSDLLEFAARFLVLGGRLVYWLPTVVDECVLFYFFFQTLSAHIFITM